MRQLIRHTCAIALASLLLMSGSARADVGFQFCSEDGCFGYTNDYYGYDNGYDYGYRHHGGYHGGGGGYHHGGGGYHGGHGGGHGHGH